MTKSEKTYYVHTIDGRPAFYYKNEQIVYLAGRNLKKEHLVKSRKQIIKEQRSSIAWRKKRGYSCDDGYCNYHYFRIRI
jgi:hypothetical protein